MSTIKANTLLHSDGSTTNPPAIPALDQRMAKAWVNFNGTGTVAIRSSYNVSSITDNGVGQHTVNFAVVMANANYSAVVSNPTRRFCNIDENAYSTSGFKVVSKVPDNTYNDPPLVTAVVFGS